MSRRPLKAALLIVGLPTLILALGVVFGSAAIEAADLVGNLSSAYGFLKRLHDNGIAIWLILLGAAALSFAIVAIPALLGRWPFKREKEDIPSAARNAVDMPEVQQTRMRRPTTAERYATQAMAALPAIHTPRGKVNLRGLGIVVPPPHIPVHFAHQAEPTFTVGLHVEVCAIDNITRPSPTHILLTDLSGKAVFATLTPNPITVAGTSVTVFYGGRGSWKDLSTAVVSGKTATSQPVDRLPGETQSSSRRLEMLFVEVALRVPDDVSGAVHRESGIKLDFELSAGGFKTMILPVVGGGGFLNRLEAGPIL